MKKWLLFLFLCLLSGCSTSATGYEKIDAAQAKEMMKEDVVILDVRNQEEYAQGHIEDAINIPLQNIAEVESIVTDKKQRILVYCRSGNRSAQAAKKLVDMDYEQVVDFGGIVDWSYDIVK